MTEDERFWSRVDIREPHECWEWKAYRDPLGYGRFRMDGTRQPTTAHRASWEISFGPIGDTRLFVCHHCDNPPCVNPDHLFLGTQKDNLIDMDSKGRRGNYDHSGEGNPAAKLTREDVIEIRRLLALGEMQKDVADKFRVSRSLISGISRNIVWRKVS